MKTVDRLRFAKARIEKGWCKGQLARDHIGNPVDPNDGAAVAWCAFGAIGTCQDDMRQADKALEDALQVAYGRRFVVAWQDDPERTQQDVLGLFDKAIELVTAGGVQEWE